MKLMEKYYHQLKGMMAPTVFNDIVPMDVSPAAKWFLGESPKEYWEYRSDFPCVLPPAPVTWIEYEMPAIIRSADREVQRPARSVAALILTLEIPERQRHEFMLADGLTDLFADFRRKSHISNGVEITTDKRPEHILETLEKGWIARWACIWQLMAEPLNRHELVPFVTYAFYLDEKGQLLSDLGLAYTMLRNSRELPEDVLNGVFSDTLPFLFCLSLTHCRNVEIVERQVPAATAKKRKEKDIPEIKFKHLVIRPIGGKQVIGNGPSAKNGMMPLSFTRAHFKTFSEERPLFGKHSGTYFWHMHAKGSPTHGEVIKDYTVKN